MKMRKGILVLLCVMALVIASVFGTLAYLTDTETATNTFTVGQVGLELDEFDYDHGTDADEDPSEETKPDGDGNVEVRDTKNKYHLLPGHTYDKDPIVTVESGSEKSYVRIIMTVHNASAVQAIIDADDTVKDGVTTSKGAIVDFKDLLTGWGDKWTYQGYEEADYDAAANTITFEFRYDGTPEGKVLNAEEELVDGDNRLQPLFKVLAVPGYVTNEQLAALETGGFQIDLVAHAIQAAGFNGNADAAWTAFDGQVNP